MQLMVSLRGWKFSPVPVIGVFFFVMRTLLQDKLVEEIFSHEDKDKDGVISHDEFSGPKHDEL